MIFKKSKGKREVSITILAITMICLISFITIAYAPKPPSPGYAQWRFPGPDPPATDWQVIPPSPNHLDLTPDQLPILIRICGIPESIAPEGTLLQIKVSNEDWSDDADRWRTVDGDGCVAPFTWPSEEYPEYTICETNVVQYRVMYPNDPYKPGNVHVVSGIIGGDKPAHIHIIPEFVFGTAMSVLSLLSGLTLYTKYKKQ